MKMKIDLVYLWVDGSDPNWLKKKQLYMDKKMNTTGRYQNNQELKYSLRSVEKHLPWIRKIFIVTDHQTPVFLDTSHPKIEIVNHTEIIPKEILPTFNSSLMEYFVYKIPDLSEHFLFANDDTFIHADLEPSFFFKEGIPLMRMKYDPLIRYQIQFKKALNIPINNYRLAIENAYKLFKKKFDLFYPIIPHHNIDACLKSDYKAVIEDVFKQELEAVFLNRFRQASDIHRILINYYAITRKRGILTYVDRKESCRIRVHKTDYQKYITKYNPKLFCLNDTEHATDAHRAHIEPFLKKLYPVKSVFEKD
ncbi:MAG: Stealth CR1 domain-containing protein [Flavobacteriaceae bacterium]|nr:Stealth CR1 domain-containing protein [Flavobacteriaceae bacterium]MDG1911361.1 Stealth CR1 domain-containing protein [Flavobacteriaceae bacterium]